MEKSTLTLFLLLAISAPFSTQYVVQEVIADSLTKEPLPYASVHLKDTTEGTTTGSDGRFYFKTHRSETVLVISVVGYNDYVRTTRPARNASYKVALAPTEYALNEVVVNPKREHYRKKDNPAVGFVHRMIESRGNYFPYEESFQQRERHEKTTFVLNNLDEKKQKRWLYRKFDSLTEYVSTSTVTGKPVLTVSARKLLATDYYRKSSRPEKQWVKGRKQASVDGSLSRQGTQATINKILKGIDIYEDNVSLFTNKFVSPLSRIGTGSYKYYLVSALQIAGGPYTDLAFTPSNSESFDLNGHLYVTLDSTYFAKRAVFSSPRKINLSFVNYMLLEQEFERAKDDTRLLDHESITVEFKLTEEQDGIFTRWIADYNDYTSTPIAEADKAFAKPEHIIEETEALLRPETLWTENHPQTVTLQQENSVSHLMTQLRSYPAYYWTEKVLSILFTGYIPTSKEAPLFYIGSVNATISGSTLEGPRVHVGDMITTWLNPRLFGERYVAYGFKDEGVKGLAELEYSFGKKKGYANELPVHSLRLRYESDVNRYRQNYLYTSRNDVFLVLRREKGDRIGYFRQTEVTYINKSYFGFSFQLATHTQEDESSYLIPFLKEEGDTYTSVKNFSISAAKLKLHYTPNERLFQTQRDHFPVPLDAPMFTLSHTIAGKGVLDSSYAYNRTEVGIQKHFWFSAFGYTDAILEVGKVWDKVSFPLLIMPNANLSYTIQPESYSLVDAMEFMSDEYLSWDAIYFLNGRLFSRVPLLKKLKWREIVSCRGLHGHLDDKNNPTLSGGLFASPIENTRTTGKTPYVEAGVGIGNIFKVLRLDYAWRLTYRGSPGIDRSGLRISLHITFQKLNPTNYNVYMTNENRINS